MWDQPLQTVSYYTGKLSHMKVKIYNNNDNLINTVGTGFRAINDDGFIINEKGEVSWICHQYDRFDKETIEKIKFLTI